MTQFITRNYACPIVQNLISEGFAPALARVLAARGIESQADLKPDWQGSYRQIL